MSSDFYFQSIEDYKFDLNNISSKLPENLTNQTLIGHIFGINGNHRTAFVIDFSQNKIEYFNSYGDDSKAKQHLIELAAHLSQKYGIMFTYECCTKGIVLQNDTYQCGIWVCKYMEEKIKQGHFHPEQFKDFNIATYRETVLFEILKFNFYKAVGSYKLNQTCRENGLNAGALFDYCQNHYINFNRFMVQWGQQKKMPKELKDFINNPKTVKFACVQV